MHGKTRDLAHCRYVRTKKQVCRTILISGLLSLVFCLLSCLVLSCTSCAPVEIFVFFFLAGELIFENAEHSVVNQSNYSGGHESVKRVTKFYCFLKVIYMDGSDYFFFTSQPQP